MNPPPPFRVTVTPPCREQIKTLTRRAKQAGLGEEFKQALLDVEQHPLHEPREWGDPYHNVPGLNAVSYARALPGLRIRVDYLVHNQQPVVILAAIRPITDSPLG